MNRADVCERAPDETVDPRQLRGQGQCGQGISETCLKGGCGL